MEKVAREKLLSKIICVALAIILWTYVSYQENPSMNKTVKNVPLVISGAPALKESGFSVYALSEQSVDVKVTAKRLNLARLTNRTLSAVINVSSIKKAGTYTLPATITSAVNSNATFYVKGKDIKVTIEPIEKDKYEVETDVQATADSLVVLDSYKLSTDEVEVSAPKSIMKEIGSVRTEPFTPEKDESEIDLKLVVYGKDGKLLEGAECAPSTVTLSYTLNSVKTVPVVLRTTSGKAFSLPPENTVKICGRGEEFDKITEIETEEVNLALFEIDSKLRIKLNLPKDVYPVDKASEIEIVLQKEFYK